jgi:uncharacterized protein
MHNLLTFTQHRPYPVADTPWVMQQTWYDLLFAHWQVPVETLRALVPGCLPLDLYDGKAYIAIVPFGMAGVYPRYTVPVPWLSYFLELNVRTYVTLDKRRGVYFFSLDAANPIAVALARSWYKLPYFNADMRMSYGPNGSIDYTSVRTHRGAARFQFRGSYQPLKPVQLAEPESLEAFLTERYCLYTVDAQDRPYRGEIHHKPWPLQTARAQLSVENSLPIKLQGSPLLHFAKRLDILAWPIQRC